MEHRQSPLPGLLLLLVCATVAHAGDTIRVQTLTFADITKRSGTWLFPPPQQYEKVLLEYTLKCDTATTQDQYPCGEWDYLTYIVLTDSTGEFDSTKLTQVNYVVRNSTPDSLLTSSAPVNRIRRYRTTTVSAIATGTWIDIGEADQTYSAILKPSGGRGRFLLRKSDLDSAGLQPGTIGAIRLTATNGGNAKIFTVRLLNTTASTVRAPMSDDGMATVIRRNVDFIQGQNILPFHQGFTWDGSSNILVEMACQSAETTINLSAWTATPQGITDDGTRRCLLFDRGDRVELPSTIGNDLSQQITIAFWAYGFPALLPSDHNVVEAFDAAGNRVLNIHLPWSNGTVYWDAGRSGANGPDRIQKQATPNQFEGSWHHWAFVKNAATRTMTIYLDGQVFMQEAGKSFAMNGITRFVIGSGNAGTYPGMLDDVQIWKTALSAQDIVAWMNKSITSEHPKFLDLIAYLTAEQTLADGRLMDESSGANHATMYGKPIRERLELELLGCLTQVNNARPIMGLLMGPAATGTRLDVDVLQEPEILDVTVYPTNVQQRIYHPDDPDYPGKPTGVEQCYQAGWIPIIDESWLMVDSTWVPPTYTYRRSTQTFYSPIVQFELGRYITPYGIGLDLGPNGFKWIYDVTDFAPLLRNNVTLSAGNQQELINMTFVMIKGLPARDIHQIDQVWYERGAYYPAVLNNTALAPAEVFLHPRASTFRVKTVTSGHDFDNPTNCAEFCPRTHFLNVDGTERFSWLLWKECGDNPVYPQGGTWLIDRTGWCPGAPVDLYEFELTPFTSGKSSVTLDYGIKPDTTSENWGRWEVSGQLIGYGQPNSAVDAELVDVLAPTSWEYYSRSNPICGHPKVVIRNRGSQPLTSVQLTYTIDGQPGGSATWSGILKFLEIDTVILPTPSWPVSEGVHQFEVVVQPSATDEYQDNNSMRTEFRSAPVFYPELEITLRTNNFAAQQYEWELRKIDGEVIGSGSNLADNTLYTDTFNLEVGCYEYRLVNKEGYGLDFWFLRNQLGSGSLQFKSQGTIIKTFEPDFGNTAWMQFSVAEKPTVAVSTDTLYFNTATPQPLERSFSITTANSQPLIVDSINIISFRNYFSIVSIDRSLPDTLLAGDTIHVTVRFDREDVGTASATIRVYSNDVRTPVAIVRAIGNTGATHVDDMFDLHHYAQMAIVPNPVTSQGIVSLQRFDATLRAVTITVIDNIGRVVCTLFEGTLDSNSLELPLPERLGAGAYYVVVASNRGTAAVPFVVPY